MFCGFVALPPSTVFYSRPSSPKSDSELFVKPQESPGPQIQWNWGGFPTVWQLMHTVTRSGNAVDLRFSRPPSCRCVNQRRHQWSFSTSLPQTALIFAP